MIISGPDGETSVRRVTAARRDSRRRAAQCGAAARGAILLLSLGIERVRSRVRFGDLRTSGATCGRRFEPALRGVHAPHGDRSLRIAPSQARRAISATRL
ncbi:hypothetical protein [Burkholderia dolosa]|uniref:hypothetical protein n=1 Tax=Burkholderia dolosa TaxID=152500 RepID=UPI001C986AF5|nr:hypothetical protein [Burkholderia dolosa]MBY4833300.1 hypothetical protein [Burkholderia dolosa]